MWTNGSAALSELSLTIRSHDTKSEHESLPQLVKHYSECHLIIHTLSKP